MVRDFGADGCCRGYSPFCAIKMQTTSGDTPKVARYDKGENYELFWFGSLSFPDYVYILCPKELFVKGFL